MTDEPTAWEDINPPMVSAQRHGQLSPYSARLEPATNEEFRNELTACLALVVPAGMTEEGRREWLAVAWGTLQHLPADLLAKGCKVARETCDHPSKIVPTIIAKTEEAMKWRIESSLPSYAALPSPVKRHVLDRRGEAMSEEETDELNGILERMGATARYRPDGSRYLVAQAGEAGTAPFTSTRSAKPMRPNAS